jgi:Protein of unknown function (DUF3375)
VDELVVLRRSHPAWRLLIAEYAPVIVTLLDRAFVATGQRQLPESAVVEQLDELLDEARASDPDAFPRAAREYLNDWCDNSSGWLRKYYQPGTDEPMFDITAPTEKAVTWLTGLMASRSFVGTESRLLTVVDLLNQIVEGANSDPDERVRILEGRRRDIDLQIAAIRGGHLPVMAPAQLRDRYQTLAITARGLLADFREVEDNFRALDRETRERIAGWEGPRGALLETVLGRRDVITSTDQGASFRAFYDFLMSPGRLERFERLLEAVSAMPDLVGIDDGLSRIVRDWGTAAEAVQRTVARLSAQMRRFLDEQGHAENRRIGDLVHRIEASALRVRDNHPIGSFMELQEPRADLGLPMDRAMFDPPVMQDFADPTLAEPLTEDQIAAIEDLFVGQRVDPAQVRAALRSTMAEHGGPLTVADAVILSPLTEGLAELVTLLEVAEAESWLTIDDTHTDAVNWAEPGGQRVASTPRMTLTDPSLGELTDDNW